MTADQVFKAMGDWTRRKLLQLLVHTELGVSELVEVLQVPQSTVSRHLKTLRQAGLVEARHEGTSATYFPVRSHHAPPGELRDQMIEWASRQELPAHLRNRLEEVLRSRRRASQAFFARITHRWDRLRIDCFGPTFHLEALTALLPREWIVADVGTGTGYLLPVLARTFAGVIAVEPVEEMLAVARRRFLGAAGAAGATGATGTAEPKVSFRRGAATNLPIEQAEVDLCIASLVLHHEPVPAAALAEFRRILRPGGMVLIIEQRAHRFREFHEMMQDHWWGFEPVELADQLREAGFGGIDIRGLTTAEPSRPSAPPAPELFVLTGRVARAGEIPGLPAEAPASRNEIPVAGEGRSGLKPVSSNRPRK